MRPVASLGAVPRQTTNTGGLFCGPREQAGAPASCESMHLNKQDSTSSGTATNDGGGLNPLRVKGLLRCMNPDHTLMSPHSSLTDYAVFGSAPPPVFIFLASGAPDPFPFVREIKERYALASILGRGSFGDVILAFDKPCVLRLLDHVLTPDDTFLVLQFCEGGPLMREDLSLLDNILLFSKEPETLIKLIDFGASNCSGSLALGTPIGSSLYVAPEVLRASLVGSTYCHQADVWSAGVVLFLCGYRGASGKGRGAGDGLGNILGKVSRGIPHQNMDFIAPVVPEMRLRGEAVFEGLGGYQPFLDHNSILNGDFNLEPSVWDKVSPPARDLVQRMLEVDTRLRISVKHILGHKWMKVGLKTQVKSAFVDESGNKTLEGMFDTIFPS
uniref:Protein kinase domain-containing protein n=1 Tax=Timema bartmani TaxID=61472 RepID=A0A7R9F3U3_9NEOP|nr:unnamed protein product [Timema bartmani]